MITFLTNGKHMKMQHHTNIGFVHFQKT